MGLGVLTKQLMFLALAGHFASTPFNINTACALPPCEVSAYMSAGAFRAHEDKTQSNSAVGVGVDVEVAVCVPLCDVRGDIVCDEVLVGISVDVPVVVCLYGRLSEHVSGHFL